MTFVQKISNFINVFFQTINHHDSTNIENDPKETVDDEMDGSKVSTTKKYEVSVRFQNDVEKTESEVHFEKNEKSRPRHKVSRNGLLPKLRTPEEVNNYSKDYLFFLSFMNSNLFDFF